MPTRLLCTHKMTKYVGKISLLTSKQLLRKLQNLRGILFAAPCTFQQRVSFILLGLHLVFPYASISKHTNK